MYRSGLVRSPARDAQRGPRPRERLLGGDLGEEVGAQLRDARRGHGVLEERPRRRRRGDADARLGREVRAGEEVERLGALRGRLARAQAADLLLLSMSRRIYVAGSSATSTPSW